MVNSAFDNTCKKFVLNYLKIKNTEQLHFFKILVETVEQNK